MCNSKETCYQFLLAVYLISKQQRTSRTKPNYKNQARFSNLLFRQVSLLILFFSLSCRSQTLLRSKLKILLLDNWYLKIEQIYVHVKTKLMNTGDDLKSLSRLYLHVGEHRIAPLQAEQGAQGPADTVTALGLRIPQGFTRVPPDTFSNLNTH